MKNQNSGTAIKCKFSNLIHKILEPNLGIKSSERWKFRDKYKFTDKQKLEMMEQILKIHNECSTELVLFYSKRRKKNKVQKERIKRGYVPKKKVKKEDYLKNSQNNLEIQK